ncbi:hypothetical protein LTR56_007782 [Elasticomyces elasticus]|nr:hypothetical protein LTR56_007782 [Elasticomyces elasticus]KAK3667831.1 hypothetical protein LTR22_001276 [Elasticomyces elasticus]KAK4932176.1 hypothetical protein LTR49_001473 [Elasticomyces elasticus]KAK5763444.1 hypothetical protein LTS12_006415 [Elasticomyces elasticus]
MARKLSCPFADSRALFEDLSAVRSKHSLQHDSVLKGLVISRYSDIVEVLDKPETFSSKPTIPPFPEPVRPIFAGKVPEKSTLLNWDNPDHDRLRLSVASFFVPRRLQRFEPEIKRLAHELVDGFVADGKADLKHSFALPLPLKVIATVAGLDPARWQWLGRSLALFGGHAEFRTGTIHEQVQGILDIHAYVAELIQERKTDRRDDLISHIWNERDKGLEMTDMEHLAMIPGLLLAGHETTTNLLSMGMSHLLHLGLWEKASKDDDSRKSALEELLRFESAVTGMRREALVETTIGGCPVAAGTQLFVAYNSGSRDPTRFPMPDVLDIDRQSVTQHLGFGRGIHACLGAPLARILLQIEMSVLAERLPGLRLDEEYSEIEYDHVHEARGISKLEVAWELPVSGPVKRTSVPANVGSVKSSKTMEVVVSRMRSVADGVVELTLEASGDDPLPQWTPGSHIDIELGAIGWRQYSLCSDPADKKHLQIAVLLEKTGRGGSRWLHSAVKTGMRLQARGVRNHFVLEKARQYVFVAGGIGITPVRPMLQAAKRDEVPYQLIYLGGSRSTMAYADELERLHTTTLWPKNEKGRFDLAQLRENAAEGLQVYCCGPTALIQGLEEIFKAFPLGTLKTERFAALDGSSWVNKPFQVRMARSGRKFQVPADESLLDVLNKNGAAVLSTCAKGTCGTCEVEVVAGIPEHRDVVLTELERLEGKSMMAKGWRKTL